MLAAVGRVKSILFAVLLRTERITNDANSGSIRADIFSDWNNDVSVSVSAIGCCCNFVEDGWRRRDELTPWRCADDDDDEAGADTDKCHGDGGDRGNAPQVKNVIAATIAFANWAVMVRWTNINSILNSIPLKVVYHTHHHHGRWSVAGRPKNGGNTKEWREPLRKDMAGKKIRLGRREKIWRGKIQK